MKRDSAHVLGLKLGTARCDRYTHSASNASDDHITRRPMPDRDRLRKAFFLYFSCLSFLSLSRTPSQFTDNKPRQKKRRDSDGSPWRVSEHVVTIMSVHAGATWLEARNRRRKDSSAPITGTRLRNQKHLSAAPLIQKSIAKTFVKNGSENRLGLYM